MLNKPQHDTRRNIQYTRMIIYLQEDWNTYTCETWLSWQNVIIIIYPDSVELMRTSVLYTNKLFQIVAMR